MPEMSQRKKQVQIQSHNNNTIAQQCKHRTERPDQAAYVGIFLNMTWEMGQFYFPRLPFEVIRNATKGLVATGQ